MFRSAQRVDFGRHYSFPRLLAAGIGCLGANTRNPNNDTDTVHEQIILDVGACVAHLRDRGVRNVILLGNSGGGSLNAFYQAQAARTFSRSASIAARVAFCRSPLRDPVCLSNQRQ